MERHAPDPRGPTARARPTPRNESAPAGSDTGKGRDGTSASDRTGQYSPAATAGHTDAHAILVTVLTAARNALLTKRFTFADGALHKESFACLTDGTATQTRVADLTAFLALLDSLSPSAALAYGVAAGHPTARVVSEKRHTNDGGDTITRTRRYFGFRRAPGIMFLDYDPPKPLPECLATNPPKATKPTNPTITAAELIATLRAVAPCLADAPMLWRPSASSGIVDAATGRALTGIAGQRVYIPVADAAQIPEAGKALVTLLWAAGHGRIEIGAAGQALERTWADASVWQPERLDFAAPPLLGPGLRRESPAAFIDGDPSAQFDLGPLIALADGTAQHRANEARKGAKAQAASDLAEAREQWIEEQAPLLAERSHIATDQARVVLARAAGQHELTGEFVLHCADGSTPTVGAILDNPAQWHGTRFADPLEPDYGQDRRIAWANLRGGGRPYLYSHAHGGRRFRLVRPSARIQLKVGDRARIVDSLLDLLRARGELYDFGEGASLARVTDDARPLPVGRDWLTDHLDRTAEFYSLKATEADQPPEEVIQDAPGWAALRIIAKDGERGIPKLDAVISAPTLRADGSILAEAGYDAASRLLFIADSPDLPHIPEAPTLAQVKTALDTLWAPVRLFPYVDAIDRGCILAALLTAAVRASIPTAPGFALDAPTAGTGKTLLAQAIGALCVGYLPPVVPPVNNQDEETRKLLFAALRDGHRVLIWDNIRDPLGNAALDAFLTSPTFAGRVLQTSSTAVLPNRALFLATGNNLTLLSDTCRRLFPVRLDARSEQPYAREFAFDPETTKLAALLSAWVQIVGTQPTTTGELIAHAQHAEALRDALEEIAGTPRGDLNRRSLGKWIAGRVDRRHNGLRITRGALRSGSPTWVLAVESGPLVGLVASGGFAAEHSADDAEVF